MRINDHAPEQAKHSPLDGYVWVEALPREDSAKAEWSKHMSKSKSSSNAAKPQLTGAAAASKARSDEKAKRDKGIRRWRTVRSVITWSAVGFIALVAAWISFDHIRDLAILAGRDGTYWYSEASAYPLTVDLLMIVASFKLREVGSSRLTRLISRVSMWVGLAASLGGNIGVELLQVDGKIDWLAVGVAGWPVVPLFLATEMLTHIHQDAPVRKRKEPGLIRQIARQYLVNKLANVKARNASRVTRPVAPVAPQAPAAPVVPEIPVVPTVSLASDFATRGAGVLLQQRRALINRKHLVG